MSKKLKILALFLLGAWLALKYVLPLAMPFLLGATLAVVAEPGVRFMQSKLHLRRSAASVASLGLSLVLLVSVLVVAAAVMYRQMGMLAQRVPSLLGSAQGGLEQVEGFLLSSTRQMPEGVQGVVQGAVERMFSNGSAVLERLAESARRLAGHIIGGIPGSALFLGTAVLSGFMISSQWPHLRAAWLSRAPAAWKTTWKPTLLRLRRALGGWLKAQLLLTGVTYLIVAGGLLLLQVQYGFLWAGIIALLDALPMIGTGIALVPWAVVMLVQGEPIRALGMVAIYIAATVTRSALEPKLLGRQLGLNPLLTLVALYAGFRLWGMVGMILSPLLAVTAVQTADCILERGEL